MAAYGKQKIFGRVIVLLLLILVLAGGGAIWFDYLNLINIKSYLGPLYKLMGRPVPTQSASSPTVPLNLDEERLSARMDALDQRSQELDKRESVIAKKEADIEQKAQELEDRQKALDEREKTFNVTVQQFENRRVNVEQNARYLVGMPPDKAVGIISAMDDQDAIDVFRMTEEIAQKEGTGSMVSYWLSLLPPARSAELQRKMAGKPKTLN